MYKKSTIEKFDSKVYLASPKMHGEEIKYVTEAYETNWMSTLGANIDEMEREIARLLDVPYVVGLSNGTAALHMAIRLAGEKIYGIPNPGHGSLEGKKVFCSDLTFAATVNPISYEGGELVLIDSEYETWNMDPVALERAFDAFPEVKLVVLVNLYGTPAQLNQIRDICKAHGAILVEDAAESMDATLKGQQTGTFGDIGIISFNGNKLITGSCGGAVLLKSKEDSDRIRKWSTQAREAAPWYQHEEIGFNYRISNVVAGVVRGQLIHIEEHRQAKREIFMRYKSAFEAAGLPISMNPYIAESEPNFWLSCMIIDKDAMCPQTRTASEAQFSPEENKSCPTEILGVISSMNAEGRPIWKPMHMQPIYKDNIFVTRRGIAYSGSGVCVQSADGMSDVGADIFDRGLCLPSDINMTPDQQDKIIEAIIACFE